MEPPSKVINLRPLLALSNHVFGGHLDATRTPSPRIGKEHGCRQRYARQQAAASAGPGYGKRFRCKCQSAPACSVRAATSLGAHGQARFTAMPAPRVEEPRPSASVNQSSFALDEGQGRAI